MDVPAIAEQHARLQQAADGVGDGVRERFLSRDKGIVGEPSRFALLRQRPFQIADGGRLHRWLAGDECSGEERPGGARVVRVRHAVVLEGTPAAVRILDASEPAAGAHCRVQTLGAAQLLVTGQHAVHDLTGIEHYGLAAGLPEVAGECTVGALERKLPVENAPRSIEQSGAIEHGCGGDEGLDDISARLRIARKPPILEAPSRRHAARIGPVVAHVLREAQPVDRRAQVVDMRSLSLLRRADQIASDQACVARMPWPIAERGDD